MNRTLLRAAVTVAWLALSSCTPPDGFTPRDDPQQVGTLKGRLLSADGSPRAGTLYLLDGKRQIVATTVLGADGRFLLDTPLVGALTLILNDGRGSGVVTDVTMYAAGVNELGDLTAALLERDPRILTFTGVGFEERRGQDQGDLIAPVYSKDGVSAYALRRIAGKATFELVRLTLTSGDVTVLQRNLDMSSSSVLTLVDDRLIKVQVQRMAMGGLRYVTVFFDAGSGAEVFAAYPLVSPAGAWVRGGALYVVDGVARVETVSGLFGQQYRYQYQLVKVDLATGAKTNSGLLEAASHDSFSFVEANDSRVVFAPIWYCHYGNGSPPQNDCPTLTQMQTVKLRSVEFSSLTRRDLATLNLTNASQNSQVLARFVPNSNTLLASVSNLSPNMNLAVDTTTGQITPLQGSNVQLNFTEVRNDGAKLLARSYESVVIGPGNTTTAKTVWNEIDVASLVVHQLLPTVTVAGQAYSPCAPQTPLCDAHFLGDGSIRISDVVKAPARSELIVDVKASGTTGRLFPLGETDYSFELVQSPDGSKEVALIRDSGGFIQIHSGAPGAEFVAMTQRSFLSAQHGKAQVSDDGAWLHYFTRDPSSGYQQLFRVALP